MGTHCDPLLYVLNTHISQVGRPMGTHSSPLLHVLNTHISQEEDLWVHTAALYCMPYIHTLAR